MGTTAPIICLLLLILTFFVSGAQLCLVILLVVIFAILGELYTGRYLSIRIYWIVINCREGGGGGGGSCELKIDEIKEFV